MRDRDSQASDNPLKSCVVTNIDEFPEGKEQGAVRPYLVCVFKKAVLVGIPLEADSETRIYVQTLYLGGDPRKHWQRNEEIIQRIKGLLPYQLLPSWAAGADPTGDSGRQCEHASVVPTDKWRAGVSTH